MSTAKQGRPMKGTTLQRMAEQLRKMAKKDLSEAHKRYDEAMADADQLEASAKVLLRHNGNLEQV